MNLEQEILEIAAIVDQLRTADTNLRVFGASDHRYLPGPQISEAEIKGFEQKHSLALPADYRMWLQLTGQGTTKTNGVEGASVGPFYGLYPWKDADQGVRLDVPFQLSLLDWNQDLPVETLIEDNSNDDGEVAGVIDLGTAGCGCDIYLIVNGEGHGQVASYWANQIWPNFSTWMRSWAETSLQRLVQDRVADAVTHGMDKERVLEICGKVGGRTFLSTERVLQFANLSTRFVLDEKEKVIRVRRDFIAVDFAPEPQDEEKPS